MNDLPDVVLVGPGHPGEEPVEQIEDWREKNVGDLLECLPDGALLPLLDEPRVCCLLLGLLDCGKLLILLPLKHACAERGGEGQCDEHRERHRGDDGDGELAVDDACRAAEEGHRDEYGGEHHGNADKGSRDLVHRLDGGVASGEVLGRHDSLDVLDDDYRVIDQKSYREHQSEHGEGVDGESRGIHYRERSEQHYRHRYGRNERSAQVLQEQVHDDEYEEDCLIERMGNRVYGHGYERGRIERVDDGHSVGKGLLELCHLGAHEP